jgi:hypothetical protein
MKPFCFSLSGIYESEGYAWEQAGKILDLRELRGTDGYLDPDPRQLFRFFFSAKFRFQKLLRLRIEITVSSPELS